MNIYSVSKPSNAPDKFQRILAYILKIFTAFQVIEFSQESFSFDTYPISPDVGNETSSRRNINDVLNKFVYAPNKGNGTQVPYGFEFECDKVYLNDLDIGAITPDGLRRRLEGNQLKLAKKVGGDVLYDMINGLGANGQILGLANIIKDVANADGQDEIYKLTKEQVQSMLVQVGIQLDLSDKVLLRTFEEMLIRETADMLNPVLIMNNFLHARMTSIAKILSSYSTTLNDFGKSIEKFGNLTMVKVPANIMPFTEADGNANKSSSIYAVDYNEVDGVRVATNSGFDFTDFATLETKPSGKTRLEFTGNTKIEDPKKLRRFSRIQM